MLPVYIVCHAECEPSSYLCEFFARNHIVYEKINALESDLSDFDVTKVAGFVFMGGPCSVNDDHPWLAVEIDMIHRAMSHDIPMMGVCFGAQLLSKVLGAQIDTADYMETGWHQIEVDTSKLAHLPPLPLENSIEVFEWHEDVFTTPEQAIAIFSGENHENQGYLLGNILVMQFHLEMTEHMVHDWLERYQSCMPGPSKSVQSAEQIREHLDERLNNLHIQADIIYGWWLKICHISE